MQANLGGLPDPNLGLNPLPLNRPEIEQQRVEQQPVEQQPVPVNVPDTVGVVETALVPEKISIELTDTQQTQPTMALLKKFLTDNNYDYKHVKNFSAQLPKNESGAEVLDTFTRKGPDGKEFTCFQGEMTFSVTVEKDGRKQTIEFSQKIETSVKVPMNGSDIEVEASMKKALFLIMGYRHTMGENFPQPGGVTAVSNAGLEALKKLEGTASFKASTTKTGDPYSFYGRALRPTELPKDAVIKSLFKKTLEYYPSITSVTLGDGTQVDTTKYWNTKIVCPDMRQRSGQLDRFVDKMKTIGDDNEPIADINTNLRNNKPSGMTIDEALCVVVRNTQNDIYSLHDEGLKADKQYIEEMVSRTKHHNRTANEIKKDMLELRRNVPDSPERAQQLELMEKAMENNRAAADDYSRAAIREKAKLTEKFEKINNTIAALEKLLKTDDVELTETPGKNSEIVASRKKDLKMLKDLISKYDIKAELYHIWVPESPGAVETPPRYQGAQQAQLRQPVVDLSEEESSNTESSSTSSSAPIGNRQPLILNLDNTESDEDSLGFQAHEDDSVPADETMRTASHRRTVIDLSDLVGTNSVNQTEESRMAQETSDNLAYLESVLASQPANKTASLPNLEQPSNNQPFSALNLNIGVNKEQIMSDLKNRIEAATTNNTLTSLIQGLLSSNLSADDVSKIKDELQKQQSTMTAIDLDKINPNSNVSDRIAAINTLINQMKQVRDSTIFLNKNIPREFVGLDELAVELTDAFIKKATEFVETLQRQETNG